MTELLSKIACAIAAYLLFQHLVSPLAVWLFQRLPCRYHLGEDSLAETFAKGGSVFLNATEQLAELGFEPVVAGRLGQQSANTTFVVFRRESETCYATVATASNIFRTVTVTGFSQMYGNGGCVSLTNSPLPLIFPARELKQAFRLPGARDTHDLYHRFVRLRTRYGHGDRVDIERGNELSEIERYMNEETRHLVDARFLSRRCHGGARRYRVGAAYLVAWKLQWPLRSVLARRDRSLVLAKSKA